MVEIKFSNMVEPGFLQGTSDNLPYLDVDMIDNFYLNKITLLAEARHSKTERYNNNICINI